MSKTAWMSALGVLVGLAFALMAGPARAACEEFELNLYSPSSGQLFIAPATITFQADVYDSNCPVPNLEFYNGPTLLATVSRGGDGLFTYAWSGVGTGTYSVRAVARSGSSVVGTVTRTVTVGSSQPPAVSLATPTGAPFIAPATIGLSATASDSDGGIAQVQFFADGGLIGTATSAPYQLTWNGVGVGSYSVTAKATDNSGMTATSAPAAVTVTQSQVLGNIDDLRPSSDGAYELTGWACSTGRDAPIDVHLYVGGAAGTGTLLGAFPANQTSEPAIATACQAHGSAYRFAIPLSLAVRQSHANKSIYVHGISPVGAGNPLLGGSGGRVIPPPLTTGRGYVYDGNQRLCKVLEPETGATVSEYDAAGNVAWTASGLNFPDQNNCNRTEAYSSGRRVDRTYDTRNRLQTLGFPDGRGNQNWTHTPDGLPLQVVTDNDGPGQGRVINSYTYNRRRLLAGESLVQPSRPSWTIGYAYDIHGSLAAHVYPDGTPVDYAPNALGQPTRAGVYANGVSYYPNGAMAQFTYGNGVVHTMTQNSRQLPDRVVDAGSTAVLDTSYDYDANGNVAGISDALSGNRGNLDDMTYDGLDRLTFTRSAMFGDASYGYDALDNLRRVKVAGRDHTYFYDPANRLTNVMDPSGTVIGLDYDVQGNLSNKSGQLYAFDYGNRLRDAAGKETYRYDAQGRRVQAMHASLGMVGSLYGQDGVLRVQSDERTGQYSQYITLNGSLLARDRVANPIAPVTTAPAQSSNGSFVVSWTAVSGAVSYVLEESIGVGLWTTITNSTATSQALASKADGTYRYRTRACGTLGCGAASAAQSVTVQGITAIELVNKVATSVQPGSAGQQRLYSISVPAGLTSINLRTYGGTGNVSLYVSRDAVPTPSVYDRTSVKPGNSETVAITNPLSGTYYLLVVGEAAFSGVSVMAVY